MKTRTALLTLSLSALLTGLTVSGCNSTTHRTPDASKPVGGKAINLLQFRDNVKSTRLALNRTTDALNRISPAPSAQDAYATFSTELASFKALADKTLLQSGEVRNNGRDLFAEWDLQAQSIQNADIRAVAEKRRVTLQQSYNAMLQPLVAARADLTQVSADLSDIQKALSLDLTRPGIDAAKKSIDQINREATASAKTLDTLAAELDKIAAELPAPIVAPVR